ncbi:MAG: Antifreeze glycoprotein [Rhodospirillaceae bacterium]|nr:MAG: Antifreeze glycoprotein [Rhodospirillaceae bacterium]
MALTLTLSADEAAALDALYVTEKITIDEPTGKAAVITVKGTAAEITGLSSGTGALSLPTFGQIDALTVTNPLETLTASNVTALRGLQDTTNGKVSVLMATLPQVATTAADALGAVADTGQKPVNVYLQANREIIDILNAGTVFGAEAGAALSGKSVVPSGVDGVRLDPAAFPVSTPTTLQLSVAALRTAPVDKTGSSVSSVVVADTSARLKSLLTSTTDVNATARTNLERHHRSSGHRQRRGSETATDGGRTRRLCRQPGHQDHQRQHGDQRCRFVCQHQYRGNQRQCRGVGEGGENLHHGHLRHPEWFDLGGDGDGAQRGDHSQVAKRRAGRNSRSGGGKIIAVATDATGWQTAAAVAAVGETPAVPALTLNTAATTLGATAVTTAGAKQSAVDLFVQAPAVTINPAVANGYGVVTTGGVQTGIDGFIVSDAGASTPGVITVTPATDKILALPSTTTYKNYDFESLNPTVTPAVTMTVTKAELTGIINATATTLTDLTKYGVTTFTVSDADGGSGETPLVLTKAQAASLATSKIGFNADSAVTVNLTSTEAGLTSTTPLTGVTLPAGVDYISVGTDTATPVTITLTATRLKALTDGGVLLPEGNWVVVKDGSLTEIMKLSAAALAGVDRLENSAGNYSWWDTIPLSGEFKLSIAQMKEIVRIAQTANVGESWPQGVWTQNGIIIEDTAANLKAFLNSASSSTTSDLNTANATFLKSLFDTWGTSVTSTVTLRVAGGETLTLTVTEAKALLPTYTDLYSTRALSFDAVGGQVVVADLSTTIGSAINSNTRLVKSLSGIGVDGFDALNNIVNLTITQAKALADGNLRFNTASADPAAFDRVNVSATAAEIKALTATVVKKMLQNDFTTIKLIGTANLDLTLTNVRTLTQVVDVDPTQVVNNKSLTLDTGAKLVTLKDSAINIAKLTSADVDKLADLHVTTIDSSTNAVVITKAQADDLKDAGIKFATSGTTADAVTVTVTVTSAEALGTTVYKTSYTTTELGGSSVKVAALVTAADLTVATGFTVDHWNTLKTNVNALKSATSNALVFDVVSAQRFLNPNLTTTDVKKLVDESADLATLSNIDLLALVNAGFRSITTSDGAPLVKTVVEIGALYTALGATDFTGVAGHDADGCQGHLCGSVWRGRE